MQRLLFPLLDGVLQEFESRFSGVGAQLMTGEQACRLPQNSSRRDAETPCHAFQHSPAARGDHGRQTHKSLLSKASTPFLDGDMFSTLRVVSQVARVCSSERSFSAFCRLHTWLMSTMGQEQLSHSAVMSTEKLPAGQDHGGVIDRFARLEPRRYSLMLPPFSPETNEWKRKGRDMAVTRKDSTYLYLEQNLKLKERVEVIFNCAPPSRN